MPQVKMPDGQVVEMPDTLTPELATRLKSLQFGAKQSESNADLIPGGGVSGSRNVGKPDTETLGQKALGIGETALAAGTGAIAGIAAPFAAAYGGLTGGMKKQNELYEKTMGLGYQPKTEAGQRYTGQLGSAMQESGIGGLAGMNEMQSLGNLSPPSIKQAGQIAKPVSENILNTGKSFVNVPKSIVSGAKNITTDLMGKEIKPAKEAASLSARENLQKARSGKLSESVAEQTHAKNMDSVRIQLENNLKQHRDEIPTTDALGTGVRNLYITAVDSAKKAREAQANIDYPLVAKAAQEKEAVGQRVDVVPVLKPLKDLREKAKGIKSIESSIDEIESAVKLPRSSTVKAPEPIGKAGFKAAVPKPIQEPVTSGKTVEQLQLSLRKLNDIAYNGKDYGFDSIITNAAKDAATTLDKQIESFVPEHGVAKSNYAKFSEPLDSLNTRLGKAITGTEGGLSKDAFNKIAAGELPNKLFSSNEGISLLKEALAGGKTATPEAVAQASKQVNDLMEKWILSKESGNTAEAALKNIRTPGSRSALESVPSVKANVEKKLTAMQSIEKRSSDLAKLSQEAKTKSEVAGQAANRMKIDIENADSLAKLPDKISQKAALTGYTNALARERSAGLISKEKYQATLKLISDANTLQEKTDRARRIAAKIAGLGTAVFIGKEIIK